MFSCLSKLVFFSSPCGRFLGVPPGRGSCPLTGPLPFDLIYTDYHGMQQMKQHMGLSLKKHKLVGVHCDCVCLCGFMYLWFFFLNESAIWQQFSWQMGGVNRLIVNFID